jgi:putative peptidoglycan lipid II flippase
MLCTLIVSFCSQLIIALLFGASADLDAYLAAIALPSMFSSALGAAVGYVLIPALAEGKASGAVPTRTAAAVFWGVLAVAAAMAVGGTVFGGPILWLTTPKLPADRFRLAVSMHRLFWVASGFSLLTGFCAAVYQSERRFLLPSVSNLVAPTCVIAGALLLFRPLGIMGLAAGYAFGILVQLILLLPIIRGRAEVHLEEGLGAMRRFAASLLPVLVSILPFTMPPVIDAYWASGLPAGSLSYLGYANRIVIAITSLIVSGLAVVLFPFLSEHAAEGDFAGLRRKLLASLKLVFGFLIPTAALVCAARVPAIRLLFQRGSFDGHATAGLAAVLPWYLAGMVGMASMNVVGRALYALSSVRPLALLSVGALGFYWLACGWLSARYSYVGIGMAYSSYWAVQLIIAAALLRSALGFLVTARDLRFFGKLALVAASVALTSWRLDGLTTADSAIWRQLLCLGGVPLLALGATAALLFRPAELRSMFSAEEVPAGQT